MSFFERFLTKVNFFLTDCANRTRFSETRSLSDQNWLRSISVLGFTPSQKAIKTRHQQVTLTPFLE